MHTLQIKSTSPDAFRLACEDGSERVVTYIHTATPNYCEEIDTFWHLVPCKKIEAFPFNVWIKAEDVAIDPYAYLVDEDTIIVGISRKVISITQAGEVRELALPCYFYSLLFEKSDRLIIVYEIGLIACTKSLAIIWECDTDLITWAELDGDFIRYATFEGAEQAVALATGNPVAPAVRAQPRVNDEETEDRSQ